MGHQIIHEKLAAAIDEWVNKINECTDNYEPSRYGHRFTTRSTPKGITTSSCRSCIISIVNTHYSHIIPRVTDTKKKRQAEILLAALERCFLLIHQQQRCLLCDLLP